MRTPITYYGGKQRMASIIISMIPKHKIYCEPFFGGGAVFFEKYKSEIEVINDNNELLINFYKICRKKFKELQNMIQSTLHSESEFIRARNIYRGRIEATDIEKAWSLWVMSNECHAGSLYGGWKFCNGSAGTHFGKVLRNKRDDFNRSLHERLSEVQISCRDGLKVIKNRDSTETFFYLDPPYPGSHQGHYYGYSENDLEDLLKILQNIKGKFILSNYWTDILRKYVDANKWNVKEVSMVLNTAAGIEIKHNTEVLIHNFDIQKTLFD